MKRDFFSRFAKFRLLFCLPFRVEPEPPSNSSSGSMQFHFKKEVGSVFFLEIGFCFFINLFLFLGFFAVYAVTERLQYYKSCLVMLKRIRREKWKH